MSIRSNAIGLMLSRYNDELNTLFEEQESSKSKNGNDIQTNQSGIPKAGDGWLSGLFDGQPSFDKLNRQADRAINKKKRIDKRGKEGTWLSNNWEGMIGAGTSLLAPAFNIGKGLSKPTEYNAQDYYNPYGDEIRSTMRDRRFNIDPILEQNKTSQAIYNRNLRGTATSSGQMLSNLGAGSAGRMRADAAAYTQKSNIDNQYLGEQAQMDYRLGDQRANVNWQTDMATEQNRAARDSMFGAGLGQLGQAGQLWSQQQAKRERDSQLASIIPEGMGSVLFSENFTNMLKTYMDWDQKQKLEDEKSEVTN